MKTLLAILLCAASSGIHAEYRDNVDPDVVSYAAGILHQPAAAVGVEAAEHSTGENKQIFGVAYHGAEASIFVVERRNGKLSEISKSDLFTFTDMSQSFEGISAESADKFSISFSMRGACGGGSQTYIFAKRKNAWRLAGSEAVAYECSEDGDDSIGSNGTRKSINFLTGNTIETVFRKDAVVSETRQKHNYPGYPLAALKLDDVLY